MKKEEKTGMETESFFPGHGKQKTLNSRVSFRSRLSRCAAMCCIVTAGIAFVQPAGARSLDGELTFLLENGCAELGNAGGSPASRGELAALCSGGGGPGTSTGGGAGITQATPGVVQERLLAARGEEEVSETGTATELMPGFSAFFSGEYESLDRDVTNFEDGFDSDITRFTAGADFQFTDKILAGLALTYSNHEGDFTGGGDFDNDSYGFTVFASFLPLEQVFVQATAGYAAKDYDRTRIAFFEMGATAGPGPAKGDYDGDEFSAGIQAGYDYTIGNITIGPRLGFDVVNTDFDSYSETGSTGLELVFHEADQTSLQSRLGVTGTVALSTSFGVVLPQISVNWVHEFDDDQRTEDFSFVQDTNAISFQYQDEEPDRDFFELAVGVASVLPNGWMPFVEFRALVGHDYLDSYAGSLGFRVEF